MSRLFSFQNVRNSESLEFKFSKFQNFQFLISETGFLEKRSIFALFFTAKYYRTSEIRQKNVILGSEYEY